MSKVHGRKNLGVPVAPSFIMWMNSKYVVSHFEIDDILQETGRHQTFEKMGQRFTDFSRLFIQSFGIGQTEMSASLIN